MPSDEASRRPQPVGEVRVDKLCTFGPLNFADDLPAAGTRWTWGDLVCVAVTGRSGRRWGGRLACPAM